jgi:arginase
MSGSMDAIAPMTRIDLIGAAGDRGGKNLGTRFAPAALDEHGLLPWLSELGVAAEWRDMVAAEEGDALESVLALCRRVAARTQASIAAGRPFVVVGGDHSCAFGTWAGARDGLGDRGPLGLVWFDAHMDAHTPETTPSGRLHGMPLAGLMGYGRAELIGLAQHAPALRPEHLCLIGVRSYEDGERALLDRLGVRVIHMDEIRRIGLRAATEEALAIAQRDTGGFGISIDLDVLDPTEAPGVGSRVAGGLTGAELADALRLTHGAEGLLGFEIAEYDPTFDEDFRTADQVRRLLAAAFGRDA